MVENESILDSIDELSVYHNYDGESISKDALKEIWDGNYVYPNINARNSRLKIRDHTMQAQIEWKGEKLSEKSTRKGLHKFFKVVVK